MTARGTASATTVAGTATATSCRIRITPIRPHEAGIWVCTQADAGPKMVELEPSVYSSGKTGGMFATAMTYGIAKTKTKSVIRDAHSNTRVSHPDGDLLLLFREAGSGAQQFFLGIRRNQHLRTSTCC